MSSRKQLQNRPFKKRQGQTPGFVKEYAFNQDGSPAYDSFDELKPDGSTVTVQVHKSRERPNRALRRRVNADQRKA